MNPSLQKRNHLKAKFVSFMPSCNWIMSKKEFYKIWLYGLKMIRNEDWDLFTIEWPKKI